MKFSLTSTDIAFAAIGLFLFACIFYAFIRTLKARSKSAHLRWDKETPKDDQGKVVAMDVPDRMVFVKYRGMVLPMRAVEKAEIWDNLSREGRNEQIDAMKKAIKQGKVKVVQFDSDSVGYLPISANLQKVRDEWVEFKRLGKIINEE